MKTTVYIEGMHCKNCGAKVENNLANIEGVKSAKVNLDKGLAVLKSKLPVSDESVHTTIDNLGYTVTKITT